MAPSRTANGDKSQEKKNRTTCRTSPGASGTLWWARRMAIRQPVDARNPGWSIAPRIDLARYMRASARSELRMRELVTRERPSCIAAV